MRNIVSIYGRKAIFSAVIVLGIFSLALNRQAHSSILKLITDIDPYNNKSYIKHIIPLLDNYSKLLGGNEREVSENSIMESMPEDEEETVDLDDITPLSATNITFSNVHRLKTIDDLNSFLYNIDKSAYVKEGDIFPIEKLLAVDVKIPSTGSQPRILIFHTHTTETFIDSRENIEEDTIVGIGRILADILSTKYKIPVLHDDREFDAANGIVEYGQTYELIEPYIKQILKKHPSIEIIIDLHRDGVPDNVRFVTEINGQQTAKIMFFNGISRVKKNGQPVELVDLPNQYIKENLSFSLKMKLTANEFYPDFTRKIYIKPYRYSLHMLPKSLLIEAGANTNTLQEVKNAMEPLAEILNKVITVPK